MTNSFPKKEHLYGFKVIEALHTDGSAFVAYPFRLVYRTVQDNGEVVPVRTMVGVSKKRFKHAVDRNRVKRLMREAYRLNKATLTQFASVHELHIHLAVQYVANEIFPYTEFDLKMRKALDKLLARLNEE